MRDIRGDLQDRASLLEEQIRAHKAQFEKLVAQIRAEHEARLKDLRAEFDVVTKLHEIEQRRLDNAPPAPTGAPVQSAPQAVPQPSLGKSLTILVFADFATGKLRSFDPPWKNYR